MDFSQASSYSFDVMAVDPKTWLPSPVIYDGLAGSINRNGSEDALYESSSITLSEDIGEQWIRIYLVVRMGKNAYREPIFTGLTASPKSTYSVSGKNVDYDVYSVLKPASDCYFPDLDWYAPNGADGGWLAKSLITLDVYGIQKRVFPITTIITDGCYLSKSIVPESSWTILDTAESILDAATLDLRITGEGHVQLTKDHPILYTLNEHINDISTPDFSGEYDWFSAPNVYRVIDTNLAYAVARDDIDSDLSVYQRGREIWINDQSPSLEEGQTLSEYAMAQLKEAQSIVRKISYQREFLSDCTVGDHLKLEWPSIDVYGEFEITSQNINIEAGETILVEEEAKEVV